MELEGLDPEQMAAATAPLGASLIVAGAGTGKTTTLTARVAWLIGEKGIPADRIVAVTFTNKAARELKERVAAKIGEKSEGLRLGTFHSISGRILRKYAEAAGLKGHDYAVVDEDEALSLMTEAAKHPAAFGPFKPGAGLDEEAVKAARKEWESGLRDFARRALRQVSLWKGWGLTEQQASDPSRPPRGEEEERFAAAYSAYQYELESRNLADFGDLILKVVRLFRTRPDILDQEASCVRHIVVDEAQDANPVQVEWVRMISSVHGGITAVGDEDQNIYGFQGGYPGAMEDMAGNAALRFVLKTNRRCTEEILKPAVLAVDYNRRKEPKVLVSGRHGDPVRATGHPTEANEAAWVAARVAELVEAGTRAEGIAVLFRTSHLIPPYEEALARKGIPTLVTSGKSLLEREEVKDVLAMVRIAVNPYDELSFQRLASRPARGLGTAAVEVLTKLSTSRSLPFHEACLIAADAKSGSNLKKQARQAAADLGLALALLAEEWKWFRHTYDMISVGLDRTGYLKWLEQQDDGARRVANVEAVHRLSETFSDAAEFLQEIALLTDLEEHSDRHAGKVRLSTIHSVKGLEFDHVFCPAFEDGIMPHPRSVEEGRKGKPGDIWNGPHGGGIEEERRLAHVAFTRARHGLEVSFAWRRGVVGGKGKTRGGGPSCFLEECELTWEEKGSATTAELGRVKSKKKRSGRVGFER